MNRLKDLRIENGKLQEDIGKVVGMSGRAIGNYETGKRDMSPDIIIKLANYFNVSTDYLLGKTNIRHTLDMRSFTQQVRNVLSKDDKAKFTIDINEIINDVLEEKKYYMCPVYGKISAGQPNWAEECIEGRLPIDPELMGIVNPEEHYFLRVNGESMNKVIRNGAYALIHKQDFVDNGEIAVVLVNGYDATLKRFNKQGDTIILSPDSNDNQFTMQIYDNTTPIKVLGKYVGKMEFNS